MSKINSRKKITAVILAGGSGRRMKEITCPKQFALILSKPMFIYSLQTYDKIKQIDEIILIINKRYKDIYLKYLKKYKIKKLSAIVNGGRRRHHSIENALKKIFNEGLVIMHNASNPTTQETLIKKCIRAANTNPAVTAYIPAYHTIFIKKKNVIDKNLKRKNIGYTAEPQVYHVDAIKKVLENREKCNLDHLPMVSLFEKLNIPVTLVPSQNENFKVTVKSDLKQVECIIRGRVTLKRTRKSTGSK